jgi:hypothetical protein
VGDSVGFVEGLFDGSAVEGEKLGEELGEIVGDGVGLGVGFLDGDELTGADVLPSATANTKSS